MNCPKQAYATEAQSSDADVAKMSDEQYLRHWYDGHLETVRAEAQAGTGRLLKWCTENTVDALLLHRGMLVPVSDPLMVCTPGYTFQLPLSSFSRDASFAEQFMAAQFAPAKLPVMLTLTALAGPIRGFDIAARLSEIDGRPHVSREVVVTGNVRVLQATAHNGGRHLFIEQTNP